MISLGKSLKEARKQAGYTQEQLAELVGVSRAAIARYETGEIEPSLETFVRLADALQVSADLLLGRRNGEHSQAQPFPVRLTPKAEAALELFIRELKEEAPLD